MKALFYSLLVIMSVGCQKSNSASAQSNPQLPQSPESKTVKAYLALGDSYTIGTAIGEEKAYPAIAVDSINKTLEKDTVTVRVIAKNGWTTSNLKNAIENDEDTTSYDVVSLLIGVNDQYSGQTLSNYKTRFLHNVNQALDYVGQDKSKLIIISIPDYSVTPFGMNNNPQKINSELVQYNAVNKQVADSLQIAYVDIFAISRTAAQHPDLVASDGLHFSAKMHTLWLPLLLPELKERIAH